MHETSLKIWESLGGWDDAVEFKNRIEEPLKNEGVEIIILKYKSPEVEKKCLGLLIDHTDYPYKLTFYDNRNNPPNMAKAWNKLIQESTFDTVIVMDTDAFVSEGWIKPLIETTKRKDCGIAYPVSGNSATALAHRHGKQNREPFEVHEHCTGYCFAMRKQVWEELGGFDEDFLVFGQDSDMCERVMETKYKLYIVPLSLVYHGEAGEHGVYEASMSTRPAAEAEEFNQAIETAYAPKLIQYRKENKFYEKFYADTNIGK